MGITIKQLAADLNVSKPTVSKAIELCGLSSQLRRVGNRFELTDEQAELIKSQISQMRKMQISQTENANVGDRYIHRNGVNTGDNSQKSQISVMEILQTQIANKDEQIKKLQDTIERLTTSLNDTTKALSAAQSLHAGTIQQQLIEAETVQEGSPVADTSKTAAAAETETPVEKTEKATFRERLSFLLHGK